MLAKPSEQVLPIPQYVGEPLLSKLCHVFWRFRFGLAALLIPFTIRIIPELIAGPYPIGYDTIGSYVPFMLDWSTGNFKSFNPFIGGWILYAVLGITYTYTHIDPVAITKLTAPLLYSGLVFSEYCFARRTLGWDEKKSGFLIVVSSLYFASLRVSWDLFRNTLGLVMLFPALILNQELLTKRRAVLLAAISWLIVATHLLVGTLLLRNYSSRNQPWTHNPRQMGLDAECSNDYHRGRGLFTVALQAIAEMVPDFRVSQIELALSSSIAGNYVYGLACGRCIPLLRVLCNHLTHINASKYGAFGRQPILGNSNFMAFFECATRRGHNGGSCNGWVVERILQRNQSGRGVWSGIDTTTGPYAHSFEGIPNSIHPMVDRPFWLIRRTHCPLGIRGNPHRGKNRGVRLCNMIAFRSRTR